eukprot:750264-Hanusia_phi.AAC.2
MLQGRSASQLDLSRFESCSTTTISLISTSSSSGQTSLATSLLQPSKVAVYPGKPLALLGVSFYRNSRPILDLSPHPCHRSSYPSNNIA